MNPQRLLRVIFCATILTTLQGCESKLAPPPPLEQLEQVLSVSFPDGCKVIGGESPTGTLLTETVSTEAGTGDGSAAETSMLWLIISDEPLPLPADEKSTSSYRSRPGTRPAGTPIPVSALLNLMAESEVTPDNLPRLTVERGSSHIGQVGDWQFTYREAETTNGWLTAVELHSTRSASSQADSG